MSEVAKVLDGIPVELPDGTIVRCRPPTVRQARILMHAYNRVVRPPLDPPVAPAETAPDDERARYAAQVASYADRAAADEAERRAAWQELVDLFPDAVGQPALADRLSPGDIISLVPDFFWKRTGARVQWTPATKATTGTAAGASGSPPSA